MSRVRARVRLAERRSSDTLVSRAQGARLNVDARKVDVPVARPFEVSIHGSPADGFDLPSLWEDLADVEVVELVEDDDLP